MSIKRSLIYLNQLIGQFGLNPLVFKRTLFGLPSFIKEWYHYKKHYTGKIFLMPFLQERYEEGGTTKDEYFWQDLLVARLIFDANPLRHVDVGSSVSGFVAHVASFREIEVFDVRPITTHVPGIIFKQGDIMKPIAKGALSENSCDSLSCLHALEHFGLGRYGDPIDVNGHEHGITNMAKYLKKGGRFYLSVPIGHERVIFNANRVFNPDTIINCAGANGLQLLTLTTIGSGGVVRKVNNIEFELNELSKSYYNLGIFVFEKIV